MKNMSRTIGNPPSNAIKFVKRDGRTNDGKEKGTLAANPATIDGIIIRAWQAIFEGNAADPQKCVDDYLLKHGPSLLWQGEVEAPDITAEGVYQALKAAGKSAASMD